MLGCATVRRSVRRFDGRGLFARLVLCLSCVVLFLQVGAAGTVVAQFVVGTATARRSAQVGLVSFEARLRVLKRRPVAVFATAARVCSAFDAGRNKTEARLLGGQAPARHLVSVAACFCLRPFAQSVVRLSVDERSLRLDVFARPLALFATTVRVVGQRVVSRLTACAVVVVGARRRPPSAQVVDSSAVVYVSQVAPQTSAQTGTRFGFCR